MRCERVNWLPFLPLEFRHNILLHIETAGLEVLQLYSISTSTLEGITVQCNSAVNVTMKDLMYKATSNRMSERHYTKEREHISARRYFYSRKMDRSP